METVCQLSYPLNSENASPFGTRTVYLAWPVSCAEVALLPRTASTETASETTTITTAGTLLLVIAALFLVVYRLRSSAAKRCHALLDHPSGGSQATVPMSAGTEISRSSRSLEAAVSLCRRPPGM